MKPKDTPCRKCGEQNWRYDERNGYRVRQCRTCKNRRQRDHRHRQPHEPLLDNARRRARESGITFGLTAEDVRDVLSSWVCVYCDTPVGSFHGGTRPNSATLDRLNPAEGYTPSNTVLACHRCNAAKAEHTPTSLRQWADRIEAVQNRKHLHEEACTL